MVCCIFDEKSVNFPFLTNIFRKSLYKKNITLGDDYERTLDILKKGYNIRVLRNSDYPRMVTLHENLYFKDILNQKIRTSMAREQLLDKYQLKINFLNFYFPFFIYLIRNSGRTKGLKGVLGVFAWIIIMLISVIIPKKKRTTQEGWMLRAKR